MIKVFVMHQFVCLVLFTKAVHHLIFMFFRPSNQIICHSNINYSAVTGHYINIVIVIFHNRNRSLVGYGLARDDRYYGGVVVVISGSGVVEEVFVSGGGVSGVVVGVGSGVVEGGITTPTTGGVEVGGVEVGAGGD